MMRMIQKKTPAVCRGRARACTLAILERRWNSPLYLGYCWSQYSVDSTMDGKPCMSHKNSEVSSE